MANKKIVVLKLREIIYTAIFVFFGIILLVLLIAMFSGKKTTNPKASKDSNTAESNVESDTQTSGSVNQDTAEAPGENKPEAAATLQSVFRPGVYTTELTLADGPHTLCLYVDADRIRAVELNDESDPDYIPTMYPLMDSALSFLNECLASGIPLSDITFDATEQYTGSLLVDALTPLLKKASSVFP